MNDFHLFSLYKFWQWKSYSTTTITKKAVWLWKNHSSANSSQYKKTAFFTFHSVLKFHCHWKVLWATLWARCQNVTIKFTERSLKIRLKQLSKNKVNWNLEWRIAKNKLKSLTNLRQKMSFLKRYQKDKMSSLKSATCFH